ncbi:nuclear prelamin A recognition factor [Anabas testudineus]|uniref:Iron hydrogenase small subunit domain-containing protein n=1 Tax=Anabas testudineus TaxID=64144 RepID=A0A3Q1HEM9_ANATE|nr:nuclear prelamin A recognition factor [Anabas testudineus]XP_026207169.1 nuclear prelamin A recognition factor [Anabas testudineus]XP_026207170.1 nuclear prelamin A recognition factor [Anabas testudineus]XP_026207171.1 nuclear prelamin A recognition factor [Anabas testudineus]
MSEVKLAKRKDKCENCTKQCNKKQGDEGASPHQERDEVSEEVLEGSQLLLSACLSCDGCLSEEETLKISQQSLEEVKQVLALNKKCDVSKHKVLVASVCPQSLPFFAVKFGLDVNEAAHKLCGFLKSLGVQYVFDTTLAAGFSILESQKEFIQRYRRRNHDSHALPMFTSSCPGWIRYSEHVLGSLVTPHICTARSPQQIMGCLVKDYFSKQQKLSPDKVYHVVVAPCFDKKFEAVREEFYNSLLESRDVDCVLTSGQIYYLMEQRKVSVEELDSVPLDQVLGEGGDVALVRHDGRGSEGFLEHIFKHAAKELFGLEVHEITYKTLRNRDFQEVTLERDGETLLQFAAVYGFRNIQTLVHRMRKGRVPYQLVEVLSCPGGCLSGRGQAESEGGRVDKTLVQQMEEVYCSLPVRLPELNPTLHTLYQDWLQGQDSSQTSKLLHTQYRPQSQTHTQPPHMQW